MAEKVNKTYRYLHEEKMKIVDEYYNVGGSTYSIAANIIFLDLQ